MTAPRLTVWPTLPPDVWSRARRARLPFPLQHRNWRLFARGRHALWHGVRALGLGPGDAVLVPAYHHGSEVESLVRAGLECRFYEADERLEPQEEQLERLLDPGARALHLTHYLGFPQDAIRWRRWCDERGLLLIEDAAQAWLASSDGRPVGTLGDLSMFCLYKTIGVPEGAALICRRPPEDPPPDGRFGLAGIGRRHAAWAVERSGLLHALTARLQHPPNFDPQRDFALRDPDARPWASIRSLLPRLADPMVAGARRANYNALLAELAPRIPPPFDRVPEGASPFALPLEVDDKRGLLERLERHGVRGLDLWSVPHPALPTDRFPGEARRRRTTIALPVHQELPPAAVERMVEAARNPRRDGASEHL